MALIDCPECGRNISDRAIDCPQCGFPVQDLARASTVSRAGPAPPNPQAPMSSIPRPRATPMRPDAPPPALKRKSKFVAYGLWLVTSALGGHRFYLGRTSSAIGIIALSLAFLTAAAFADPMVYSGLTFFTLALGANLAAWLLVDFVSLGHWVDTHNAKCQPLTVAALGPEIDAENSEVLR